MSDLEQFKAWLIEQGAELLEPEGYEVIRVMMPGHDRPLIMYQTSRKKQEWMTELLELYNEFNGGADGEAP